MMPPRRATSAGANRRVASSSLKPCSAVSGVRSSCEAMATNSDFMRSISTSCRVAAVTFSRQLVGEPPLARRQPRVLEREPDVGGQRRERARSSAGMSPARSTASAPTAPPRAPSGATKQRRGASRAAEVRARTAGSPLSSTRATAEPRTTLAAAGHRQPAAVLHGQADDARRSRACRQRAQPRQREVERRVAVERPLHGREHLVARALPSRASRQRPR